MLSKPSTAAEKPAAPIDQVRHLDRLIRENVAVKNSREQELVAMLGGVDVEAILFEKPELLSEKGEDILRISEMRKFALVALRGAHQRLMTLAPEVINGLEPSKCRIRELHQHNLARVRESVAKKLRAAEIDEGAIGPAVNRSRPVMAEFAFQNAHPASPFSFSWERGEGGIRVMREPHASSVVHAYDLTMANLAATEAHTKELDELFK